MNNKEATGNQSFERILGAIDGESSGPTIVAIGGMHGNERAGVRALQAVFNKLDEQASQFNGTFLGLCGNLAALRRGVRYIDEDMNRIWLPSVIDEVQRKPFEKLESSERKELKKLLEILDDFIPRNPHHPVILLDLHSFSATGKMVAITAQNQENIRLFSNLGAPLVFGIQQVLRGAALNYYQGQGWITVALEGGQHHKSTTIQNMMASVMVTLDAAGCLQNDSVADLLHYKKYLTKRTKRLPAQVELVDRHLIDPDDDFEMLPDFENFQHVKKGEFLAVDQRGKIRAPCDGYLLMPLYQKQGNDGFFVTRVVNPN